MSTLFEVVYRPIYESRRPEGGGPEKIANVIAEHVEQAIGTLRQEEVETREGPEFIIDLVVTRVRPLNTVDYISASSVAALIGEDDDE